MRVLLRILTISLFLSAGPALAYNDPAPLAQAGEALAESAAILRDEARNRAATAAQTPAAPAQRLGVEDPFRFELEMFAADAMRLSRQIDAEGGPQDLRCIFRGMSADAEARLDALDAAGDAGAQARIYREVAALMNDAALIAPDLAEDDPEADAAPMLGGCPSAL